MSLVFVYGTLKRGGSNHNFLAPQAFVGVTRTRPGFRLYELDGYPGMVADPIDTEGVAGEVWSVDPAGLAKLDWLEGVSEGLYRREPIPLLAPFAGQSVEAYLYARDISGRPALGSDYDIGRSR
ncbi:MAG: hypothetical protein JWM32_525 [Verrucomicrobia bacterium]|nr:hypothetical protein [Verrucomicrobiota bacterium]